VIEVFDELADQGFDHLEVAHHFVGIERFGREHTFYPARVSMGEAALVGVFGQHVSALHFKTFTDSKHHK
jgi:hypothetical protein